MRTPFRTIKWINSSSSGGVVYNINDETYQNWMFDSYPDFKSILIDWDRDISTEWDINIYWHTVDALSGNATRTSGHKSYKLWKVTKSVPQIERKLLGNFTFCGWEKVWRVITATFMQITDGSGSVRDWYPVLEIVPSIYLIHKDGTVSGEIEYAQSGDIECSRNTSDFAPYFYTDTSETTLTAQEGDRLVVKLNMKWTYPGESSVPISLINHTTWQWAAFVNRYPIQISVE